MHCTTLYKLCQAFKSNLPLNCLEIIKLVKFLVMQQFTKKFAEPSMSNTPDFKSIKQISPYGVEYWSARDLAPLLGNGLKALLKELRFLARKVAMP
jgi:hypothetical protein